jgi:hypothetical protein
VKHRVHVRAVLVLAALIATASLSACGSGVAAPAASVPNAAGAEAAPGTGVGAAGSSESDAASPAGASSQDAAQADSEAKSLLRTIANEYETHFTEFQAYPEGEQTANGFKVGASGAVTVPEGVAVTAKNTAAGAYGSYCLSATTASGNTFYYDSAGGGLSMTAC